MIIIELSGIGRKFSLVETNFKPDRLLTWKHSKPHTKPPQQRSDLAAMLQVESTGEPLSYDDAGTMLGYQQALKGEGLSRAEVNAHMEKVFAEIENGQ